jgi:hypothetical protein
MPSNTLLSICWKWVFRAFSPTIPLFLQMATWKTAVLNLSSFILEWRPVSKLCRALYVALSLDFLGELVPGHTFWLASLEAQSAAFKVAPGCLPCRDFWWCLYYFEIKKSSASISPETYSNISIEIPQYILRDEGCRGLELCPDLLQ